jgi:ABC-type antimicrobial peptide transport system permease subunit
MLKNYFKIAWRNLTKHKVFSIINIIGLTIGFSASFVIGLIIFYDSTFDTFHKDSDRIYRVVTDFKTNEGGFYNSGVTLALKDAIAENSNFELVSDFYIERPMKVENKALSLTFKLPKFVIYTDDNYFKLFDYKFLAGNKQKALSNPNSVILTDERAANYFPKMEPSEIIGKTLVYNDSIAVTVTGIVENFKERTDFVFEEFLSSPTILQTRLKANFVEKNWNNTNSKSQLFVKLSKGGNTTAVLNKFNALTKAHEDEDSKKFGDKRLFNLQPLNDIHFNEDYGIYDWSKGQSSKALLTNLALVALFLLLLGCINFINLNTAQATQRAKEIGIRKTLGSSRKQLIIQFMGETFLLVLFSALLSLFLSKWLISVFSDFVPEQLSFELFKSPILILSIILLLLLVTFMSGLYPAFILSRLNTISILKNNLIVGDKKVKVRKFLTVFQFSIAQVFIIGTLLVGKQINFLLTKDMGFKTEAIVSTRSPVNDRGISKKKVYTELLKAMPEIKKISLGAAPPASQSTSSSNVTYIDNEKEINSELQFIYGDVNYVDVFKLNLLAGRIHRNDTVKELVINETYRKTLGLKTPQEAIGKTILYGDEPVAIVGVMSDFNQRSLKSKIKPMALRGDWNQSKYTQFNNVHIALQNSNSSALKETMSKIEEAFKTVYPGEAFRSTFFDESIQRFYSRELKISKLLNWATGLSILISCLGLLGLVIYTTERRVKEIGVRKVLGASLLQINTLLCKEFIVLVVIAFVIAAPIAWYGINNWLQDFVYKATISIWVFLLSGIAMIFFALLVMSIKTLQAAIVNPTKSLKSE